MKLSRIQAPFLASVLFGLAACTSGGAETTAPESLDTTQSAQADQAVDPVETLWQQHTRRRADIEQLFQKVVKAPDPESALHWLRVYILSLVANKQARINDREAVTGLEQHAAFLAKRHKLEDGVGSSVAEILDDVKTLKAVLASPQDESPEAPKQ